MNDELLMLRKVQKYLVILNEQIWEVNAMVMNLISCEETRIQLANLIKDVENGPCKGPKD